MHQKTTIKIRKNNIFVALFVLISLVACDSKRVYDSYISVSDKNWKVAEKIVFDFTIFDTISKRNLFINIRNNKNYEFSNLFLITELKFPSGEKVIDTLEYEMADASGKFLGKGFSDIKENKLYFKESKRFPTAGKYSISISQAMRKNGEAQGVETLAGVTDVGFRIEKIN